MPCKHLWVVHAVSCHYCSNPSLKGNFRLSLSLSPIFSSLCRIFFSCLFFTSPLVMVFWSWKLTLHVSHLPCFWSSFTDTTLSLRVVSSQYCCVCLTNVWCLYYVRPQRSSRWWSVSRNEHRRWTVRHHYLLILQLVFSYGISLQHMN